MNTEQKEIDEAVEKCTHNDYCPIRLGSNLEYCTVGSMPMCRTARFYDKFGVDYYVRRAGLKAKPQEYNIEEILLLA